jgi:hypothetical protein
MTCLALALFMGSCDTDIETVDINEPGIETQNTELYTTYLTNLKAYKASTHKVVFGWFDNSKKMPASQGQSIIAVPDSIDYLVLASPTNLNTRELNEIETIRTTKATKTLYEINFETIRTAYDAELQAFQENADNAGKTFTSFNTYLVDTVQARLALCEKYNYDGVVMTFYGKSKIYLGEDEKTETIGQENDFVGIAKDWKERHTDKMLVLAGKPQNITDQTIFDLASYIIIPCESATSQSGVTYLMDKAAVTGVPTNKLLPLVTLYSLDTSDTKTGYWTGGAYAAIGAAQWAASDHDSFTIAGLALDNINNDYYHATFVYPTVRKAISIINPTVKK